ncbi:MAG: heme NO-binding domain-containing protein [Planctomycetes bacterium]|nr:heme NO-binding domain-containing protein [Planctomycetota bacterium]
MVGLIHKLLFDLIEEMADKEKVLEVKRKAGVDEDKAFRMDEVYDDDEWQRLFAATCTVLGVTQEQAEEAFAEFFYKDSTKRWPMWFSMSKTAREFLQRQPKIHNGFATGVRDQKAGQAINDKFEIEHVEDGITVHYRSPNQLCGLYMALARCLMKHYGDEAAIEETKCLKQGDSECEIRIRWAA